MAVTTSRAAGHIQRWLPVVAAGALAAYALQRGLRRRRPEKGTGFIADRYSDTRQKLGAERVLELQDGLLRPRPAFAAGAALLAAYCLLEAGRGAPVNFIYFKF